MKMIHEDIYKEHIVTKRLIAIFLKSSVPIRGNFLLG
jgi:hypothetical protein